MTQQNPRQARETYFHLRAYVIGVLLAGMLPAGFLGCSDGRPRRVPVSGVVLIDGKPLSCNGAAIRVVPKDARAATGKIDSTGRFTLGTYTKEDGCVPGRHRACVVALEVVDTMTHKWHAPKKYRHPASSGLVVDVDGPTDSLTVELTWGGKPGPILERISSGEEEPY